MRGLLVCCCLFGFGSPQEGDAPVFLYYDHMHHTWVFNEQLDLHNPQPLAFLAHGAILPISKKNDNTFRKYGAPKSVHWIVREGGGSRPDGTVKVEGKTDILGFC